jgi:DNA invertase Pin-like site-specific DNA recombinase
VGLESQKKICEDFIHSESGNKIAEFMDVESGTHRDRRGLREAITFCQANKCGLVIAKLDRLCRDVEFCFRVVNTGIDIHFCDMPTINTLLLGVFASVAQYERELTSDRTKKALAVKKAHGCKLGASSEKYKETYYSKSKELIDKCNMEKGRMKRERWQSKKETQMFAQIIRKEFPDHCTSDYITKWEWLGINCKRPHLDRMLASMAEYKSIDSSLFRKWDFSKTVSENSQNLRSYMQRFKRSYGIV